MVRNIIRPFDLLLSLTCPDNVDEVLYLVDVNDEVNWDYVRLDKYDESPGKPHGKSPGRPHPTAADVIYWDPYVGAAVSRAHALQQDSLP